MLNRRERREQSTGIQEEIACEKHERARKRKSWVIFTKGRKGREVCAKEFHGVLHEWCGEFYHRGHRGTERECRGYLTADEHR